MDLKAIMKQAPALKGSIIEDILAVMADGSAEKIEVKDSISEGAKEIGEMNLFEKALFALREKYEQENEEALKRLSGLGKPFSSEEMPEILRTAKTCKERYDTASKMLWENIRSRLHASIDPESTSVGVCKGCKIYMSFEERMSGSGLLGTLAGISLLSGMLDR